MNKQLMETIVRHIFASFAVVPSAFINLDKTKSLMNKEFLLPDSLPFESDDPGQVKKNRVWGCQLAADQQDIKILLGDCSEDSGTQEYALLVQLKDAPIYGVYLVASELFSEPMIAVTMNGKEWMECNTYFQATFLAGMEQIKQFGFAWNKCSDYKDQLDMLLSFINFHHTVYGDRDEG